MQLTPTSIHGPLTHTSGVTNVEDMTWRVNNPLPDARVVTNDRALIPSPPDLMNGFDACEVVLKGVGL